MEAIELSEREVSLGAPRPSDETKMMRVDADTHAKVSGIARIERRTIQAQLAILVEAGMENLGYGIGTEQG